MPEVYFRVPLVVGHDEDQRWLEDTGLPAWGWVTDLWRDGDALRVNVAELAQEIAALIEAQRYTSVSAEFYDNPPPPCPGSGLTFRRLAILGGDLPQVKAMADIPMPDGAAIKGMEIFRASTQRGRTYTEADLDAAVRNFAALSDYLGAKRGEKKQLSEQHLSGQQLFTRIHLRRYVPLANHAFAAFSEVQAMPMTMDNPAAPTTGTADNPAAAAAPPADHDALCERMAEVHGADPEVMKDAPDHVLAEMVRVCDAKDEAHAAEKPAPAVHPMDEDDETKWQMPDDEEGRKKFRENVRKWAERLKKFSAKYGEAGSLYTQDVLPGAAQKMSESELAVFIQRQVEAALKNDKSGTIAELNRFHEETVIAERRRAVEAFCESAAKDGKLLPSEFLPRKGDRQPDGAVYRRLMRADAREKTVKFSEGGRSGTRTDLEDQMAEISARRSMFAERFKDPVDTGGGEDAEVIKLSEHYDLQAARYRGIMTKEEQAELFKSQRKQRPELTADEFLDKYGTRIR